MTDYSLTKYENGLLVWEINRPEKRNAVNWNVMDGLEKMLEQAERDSSVKLVAITGTGEQAFCAGGDIGEFQHLKTEEQALSMLSKMGGLLYRLAVLPKLTVAAINGAAFGGGCELAAACDIRIARKRAKLGFVQAKLAITTGWGGSSLLFERMNPSQALLLLTEANARTSEELVDSGFIEGVFPEMDHRAIQMWAEQILNKDADVLRTYKQNIIDRLESTDLKNRMKKEIERCAVLWAKDEHHERVSRFLNRALQD